MELGFWNTNGFDHTPMTLKKFGTLYEKGILLEKWLGWDSLMNWIDEQLIWRIGHDNNTGWILNEMGDFE